MNPEDLRRTPLFDLHESLGGKMVAFAGYLMPLHYRAGMIKEHLHTRNSASLFDVSHMGQIRLKGNNAAIALESLVPVDVIDLAAYHQRYALFTNSEGGIIDDLIITNASNHLLLVVNGACKAHDIAHLKTNISQSCEIQALEDYGLLALQGPKAGEVMHRLAPQTSGLVFMTARPIQIDGVNCFISRSGYTGEDGFEISMPGDKTRQIAKLLLDQPEVKPCGLGARDSLRLEAGLCLYGHDLTRQTTPVQASLLWALSKSRREQGARAGGYPGDDVIFKQINDSPDRKRVGLQAQGRVLVREGAVLQSNDGTIIGTVTSGGFGPTINGPVAMGYVQREYSNVGCQITAIVRDKPIAINVVKLPFVAHNYYRG